MEKKILGIEGTIEEIDSLVKVNVKSKKLLKHNIQEINRGYHEKTTAKNNKNRRRISAQQHKKYI